MHTRLNSHFRMAAISLSLIISGGSAFAATPAAGAACATINSTSDYMNCLRTVNPLLASHIDAAPGGADGYFNKLSQMTGIPVSSWISNKNPPTPEQVAQALSRQHPENQSWITGLFQRLEAAVTGGKPLNLPMAQQNSSMSGNTQQPDSTSGAASIFGGSSATSNTQTNSPAQLSPQQQQTMAAARTSEAIANDPGVSLFKRVEQKYQEVTPRMTGTSTGQALKEWGH